jgi:hypothetical protein
MRVRRMEASKPGFWIALSVGGAIVGAMSAFQQMQTKEQGQSFRMKSVVRDFILGAFLTAVLYMFVPESILSAVSFGQKSVESIGEKLSAAAGGATVPKFSDFEIQTGPARF